MDDGKSIILIYNADGTIRGKLRYAYRKLRSSPREGPACAACDITHGGLSLSEAPRWVQVKQSIEGKGWRVLQWHRDEVDEEVREWAKKQRIRYPVVLTRRRGFQPEVVVSTSELNDCGGKPDKLYELLAAKQVFKEQDPNSNPSSSL